MFGSSLLHTQYAQTASTTTAFSSSFNNVSFLEHKTNLVGVFRVSQIVRGGADD